MTRQDTAFSVTRPLSSSAPPHRHPWLRHGWQVPALAALLLACNSNTTRAKPVTPNQNTQPPAGSQLATFAGGCFWCMEGPFERIPGVHTVISGYSGGPEANPTYPQVSAGRTGHTESVQITFDPQIVSYESLLSMYWKSMNPTDAGGQFADRGSQYRPTIFVHDETQRKAAEKSKRRLAKSERFDKPVVVPIESYRSFYPAEDYHQNYYRTNYLDYKRYYEGSGRGPFLRRVWGDELKKLPPTRKPRTHAKAYRKPSEAELRKRLTPIQYKVTQQEGTEPPFGNPFWDNKHAGIYVDVVSGEPLFSSVDKFSSGTGWPSFARPLVAENVREHTDVSLGVVRTEIRSKRGDSHLGHVFRDGPQPTGLRYCINSASLRFIPAESLAREGYGEFTSLFKGAARAGRVP